MVCVLNVLLSLNLMGLSGSFSGAAKDSLNSILSGIG
jgi:hypothetical protein